MDYAFVPGVSSYEDLLKRAMQARRDTKLIAGADVSTIADFLETLRSQSLKADALIVGAHASDRSLAIGFDKTTQVPKNSNGRDYEMLEAVSTAGTIHTPAEVREPTTNFHVKGCNIGDDQAQPLLSLLKKALDNPQGVTAPKYIHALKADADRGVLEYMLYEYTVMNKTAFPDTKALVSAFQSSGSTQDVEAGGTPGPVPSSNWKTWVKSDLDLSPALSDEVKFNFPTKVVPPAGKLKVISVRNAKCTSRLETWGLTVHLAGQTIPPDKPGRMALLRPALLSEPRLKPGHLFPIYKRLGFADFDSFFDGLTWDVSLQGTDLIFTGQHFVYTVEIPIVKKGTNKLIYNYYPSSGKPKMNFQEDNAGFVLFGQV